MNAPTTNSPWLEQRERGSRSATRFMTWFALRGGRRVASLLLYPIGPSFLLSPPRVRRASRQYPAPPPGRPPRFTDLGRHYFPLARTEKRGGRPRASARYWRE